MNPIQPTKYGNLVLEKENVANENFWTTTILHESEFYEQEISVEVNIFSKNQPIPTKTIAFSEKIIAKLDFFLKKSVEFIQKSLLDNPHSYAIQPQDQAVLDNPPHRCLLLCEPSISFNDTDFQWLIRFAQTDFSFCEPFGIAVFFKEEIPDSVDTLEDAEEIDY